MRRVTQITRGTILGGLAAVVGFACAAAATNPGQTATAVAAASATPAGTAAAVTTTTALQSATSAPTMSSSRGAVTTGGSSR